MQKQINAETKTNAETEVNRFIKRDKVYSQIWCYMFLLFYETTAFLNVCDVQTPFPVTVKGTSL